MQGGSVGPDIALKAGEGARSADADASIVLEQRPDHVVGSGPGLSPSRDAASKTVPP